MQLLKVLLVMIWTIFCQESWSDDWMWDLPTWARQIYHLQHSSQKILNLPHILSPKLHSAIQIQVKWLGKKY